MIQVITNSHKPALCGVDCTKYLLLYHVDWLRSCTCLYTDWLHGIALVSPLYCSNSINMVPEVIAPQGSTVQYKTEDYGVSFDSGTTVDSGEWVFKLTDINGNVETTKVHVCCLTTIPHFHILKWLFKVGFSILHHIWYFDKLIIRFGLRIKMAACNVSNHVGYMCYRWMCALTPFLKTEISSQRRRLSLQGKMWPMNVNQNMLTL